MNKKVNTLLFILGATLFNILVTIASFAILMLLYAKFIMSLLPEFGQIWGIPIIFVAAIIVSFFVYRFVLKYLMKKVQIEKYFDPIFRGRK